MSSVSEDESRVMTGITALIKQTAGYPGNDIKGFWGTDPKQHGSPSDRLVAEYDLHKLMLVVTEIGEAAEGLRKPGPSDKIPEFTQVEEELADAMIRIADYAAARQLRLGDAIVSKLRYNASRPPLHGKLA